jgi:hypothetical protein
MSIRAIKVNDRKAWQARVAFKGLRKSTIRPSKDEARQGRGGGRERRARGIHLQAVEVVMPALGLVTLPARRRCGRSPSL